MGVSCLALSDSRVITILGGVFETLQQVTHDVFKGVIGWYCGSDSAWNTLER